ncbi:hypothetical protein [uncultured Pseudosulfitobacter sp.]|uniref:hypothetical protein n=1 Tax=uncultured Pseudosulfitobacter sp. TaxID=2854214 RepID=UPI0030DC284B|tara:strand:- start:12121 stop:12342 length:222 start_codon:yes stop_codon:yes gene_type:complete
MKALIVFITGLVVFGVTFAGWVYLNGFGCGMNPTGCGGFSLNWSDFEALQIFLPTFILGAVLMLLGVWMWWRR